MTWADWMGIVGWLLLLLSNIWLFKNAVLRKEIEGIEKKLHDLSLLSPSPSPKLEELECGCGHHLSFHDRSEKKCHGIIKSTAKTERQGNYFATDIHENVPCGCQEYIGPEQQGYIITDLLSGGGYAGQ